MKTLNRNIYTYIPLYWLDYPLFIFGVLLAITTLSIKGLLIIPIFWLASSALQGVVTHLYNNRLYSRFLIFYLFRYRNCTFERVTIAEYLSDDIVNVLLTERLGIQLTGKPLGFICVTKRKKGAKEKQYPGAMTAFPFETQPWYIMLSDDKSDLLNYQWFLLLHEVGHTMVYHKIPFERMINLPVQIIFLTAVLFFSCQFNFISGLIAIALAIFSCFYFAMNKVSEINSEIIADTFSLLVLSSSVVKEVAEEHIETLQTEKKALDELWDKNKIKDLEKRIENTLDVMSHRMQMKKDEDLYKELKKFNMTAKSLLWPKWYSFLLILALIILGLLSKPIITTGLILFGIGIIMVGFGGAIFLAHKNRTTFIDRIEFIMKNGEVPVEMLPNNFIEIEEMLRYFNAQIKLK